MGAAGIITRNILRLGARTVLPYAGYQIAANTLDAYAERNLESGLGRAAAGAASLFLRWKSYTVPLRGAAAGLRRGYWTRSKGSAKFLPAGGRSKNIDSFLAAVSLSPKGIVTAGRVLGPILGSAAGKLGLFPWTMAKGGVLGTGEYAKAAGLLFTRKGQGFLPYVAQMKHPFAPPFVLGMGLGGVAAYASRDFGRGGPSGWVGVDRPVNVQNFGMGIHHGLSPASSPVVMGGQRAVTERMLTRRRAR